MQRKPGAHLEGQLVKLSLNLILILVSFFACFFDDIYLCLLPPRTGTVVPFTVRSQQHFNFDQEKALGDKRQKALSQYVPLYAYVPDRSAAATGELQRLFEKIDSLNSRDSEGIKDFQEYVKAGCGLELSDRAVRRLIRYPDLKNFIQGILTVEESILQDKIVKDPSPLFGKKTIEVLYPKPSGIVVFPTAEVMTLEAARLALREKVQQLFWRVDKAVLDPVLEISVATLGSNLEYDEAENQKRIEEIIHQYPSKVIPYEPGQVIMPFRKTLTENDLLLLSAYRDEMERDLYGKGPWVLVAILFTSAFYGLFLDRILKDEWRKDPPYRLFLSLLIVTVILMKACLLFTPLPVVALPFALLPLLIVLLYSDKVSAAWTTLTAAVLVSLFAGRTLGILLFFAFGGVAAIIVSSNIRKRMQIIVASLVVGTINAVVFSSFSLNWTALFSSFSGSGSVELLTSSQAFHPEFFKTLGWAFTGGLAAGPLAMLLLPLLEMSWHTASAFKLNQYADLQHPLLKDLLTKTPATYQHTMTVAYLAQSVGEVIGANSLLMRIGAYYHDIGKVADPKYFAENQSNGKNPHDDMDPRESARVIIGHVVNGEKIGRGMNLPQEILDLIAQHHGTQLVEYFYSKAVKHNGQGEKVRKEDFQYPGPKPQSVEAAILMICDAVEAASRSLESPTREKIENMVRLLLVKRIADGQFDECHLSTRYLAQIFRTLVDCIEASFHSRVVYPWQEKEKAKEKRRRAASA